MAVLPLEAGGPHMTTMPPSPTLASRYCGADGGRGRAGAVQRTVAVACSDPAVAFTVVVPCAPDVKPNVARPPVVAEVAPAGTSLPVPVALNVTGVPSATGRPALSRTSAATRRPVPAASGPAPGERRIVPVAAGVHVVDNGAASIGPPAPGTAAVTVVVPARPDV